MGATQAQGGIGRGRGGGGRGGAVEHGSAEGLAVTLSAVIIKSTVKINI